MISFILSAILMFLLLVFVMRSVSQRTFSISLAVVFGALAYCLWLIDLPMVGLWAGLIGSALVLGVNS